MKLTIVYHKHQYAWHIYLLPSVLVFKNPTSENININFSFLFWTIYINNK